jgi:hypothetical protein
MSIVLVGSTSGSVTLQEPAIAGSTVLDLPATSGTILTSASAISASSITTGTLPKAQLPTGTVLQVVQTVKTDTFTTTSTTPVDLTGLGVNITPTSASNKILIMGVISGNNTATGFFQRYLRNSTVIGVSTGDTPAVANGLIYNPGGSTQVSTSFIFLDSPATTSSITYKSQIWSAGGSTTYINIAPNGAGNGGGICTITVMEIAA